MIDEGTKPETKISIKTTLIKLKKSDIIGTIWFFLPKKSKIFNLQKLCQNRSNSIFLRDMPIL